MKLLSERHAVEDDPEAIQRYLEDRGWSDGLPVVAPTPERVERMIGGCARAADEVVAEIDPARGAATVEKIAINALMAGCCPEYMPVVIAAVEAIAAPEFNLHGDRKSVGRE